MPPSLPIELLRPILSNLATDHQSLKACALVARFWLPEARRLLFHTIRLTENSDYPDLINLFTNPGLESYVQKISFSLSTHFRWVYSPFEDIGAFLDLVASEPPRVFEICVHYIPTFDEPGSPISRIPRLEIFSHRA